MALRCPSCGGDDFIVVEKDPLNDSNDKLRCNWYEYRTPVWPESRLSTRHPSSGCGFDGRRWGVEMVQDRISLTTAPSAVQPYCEIMHDAKIGTTNLPH